MYEAELQEFQENGLVILRDLFSERQLNAHLDAVHSVREQYDIKDENGFGDRIGQLHQRHPELMELVRHPDLLKLLGQILDDEPVLFGSLNFEKGSQQAIHIDSIFFWTEPYYAMAGVWVALEDVDMHNGPLMYIPGSHKWPMIRSEDLVAGKPDMEDRRNKARKGKLDAAERGELAAQLGNIWTDRFAELRELKQAEVQKIALNKGDVVIWHAFLAHGGGVIKDPSRSRNSVVYHFIGRNAELFSFEKFMFLNRDEFTSKHREHVNIENYGHLKYIKYPYFVTYNRGEQFVHNLEH